MARVAVDVVIKPEILDPQGKAILAALGRTGHPGVTSVRQGKHFDLEVDNSVSDDDLEELAGTLLANPVIETWTVTRIAEAPEPRSAREAAQSAPEAAQSASESAQSAPEAAR